MEKILSNKKVMCNCVEAAINRGYIIWGSTYDEEKYDFVDTDDYYMPLLLKDERGRFKPTKLKIKCCPICGEKLVREVSNA